MHKPFALYTPLPNPTHLLLLKACLLPSEQALHYWHEWKATQGHKTLQATDPKLVEKIHDPLDQASRRLLPMLYRNLEPTPDPIIAKMRGLYRQYWVMNQRKMYRAKTVIDALHGIPTMLLKGAALSLVYYQDLGVRTMGDIDVMVPVEHKAKAIAILQRPPLSYKNPALDKILEPFSHALHFLAKDGLDLDLHWHLIHELRYADADRPFWQDREMVQLDPLTQSSVPSPTHLLLHTIIHGMKPEAVAPIRWVADAYMIVQSRAHDINWSYLLQMIEEYRFTLFFKEAIDLLVEEFKTPIPDWFVGKLHQIRTTPKEQKYYEWIVAGNDFKPLPIRILRYPQKAKMMHELFLRGKIKESFTEWFSLRFADSLWRGFKAKW